jgi:hypothetical protein
VAAMTSKVGVQPAHSTTNRLRFPEFDLLLLAQQQTRLIRCDVLPRALSFGATSLTCACRHFFLLSTLLECEACVENAGHIIASLLGKLAHTVAIAILSYPCNTF